MSGRRDGSLFRTTGSAFRGSRLAAAVGIGILLGFIWAYLYPHGFFLSSTPNYVNAISHSSSQGSSCESPERVKLLKSELQSIRETNANLRKQVRELSSKIHLSEQGQHSAQTQTSTLETQVKVGPIGSVKSLRTNPTILPDESINPELAELLRKIAVDKELIVGLANYNVKDMVEIWSDSIKRAGITNYLVVALDDSMAEYCKSRGVPVYRRDPADAVSKTVGKTGDNHAISGLKFHLLREFLQLGYSVLLSDVDIVYLQNPFDFLYRDCDVESMTDGHTNLTAYGYDDVFDDASMGWSRYAHTMRIWVFNSGFFYIRPTIPSIELLDRVVDRLSKEKAWDQAVFNELLFFPSHPGYEGLHASRRAMDYYLFLNSKVLFRKFRKEPEMASFKPVIIHINYHPDKLPRMKAVVEYYVHGKKDALKPFPDGSEW